MGEIIKGTFPLSETSPVDVEQAIYKVPEHLSRDQIIDLIASASANSHMAFLAGDLDEVEASQEFAEECFSRLDQPFTSPEFEALYRKSIRFIKGMSKATNLREVKSKE